MSETRVIYSSVVPMTDTQAILSDPIYYRDSPYDLLSNEDLEDFEAWIDSSREEHYE